MEVGDAGENRYEWAALAAAALVAIGLRLQAATTAYWFDEIWSTDYALASRSLVDLYAIALDNNHLLNTAFLHWIGPRDGWLAYRALSLAAGVVTLAVVAVDAPRVPRAARVLRVALLGASPLLVLLSSEARGYAPAIAAALLSFRLLQRWLDAGGVARLVAFNLLLPLGLASHLTFLHFYVAAFAYAAARGAQEKAPLRVQLGRLAALFVIPAAVALAHGALFVAEMRTGGGPAYSAFGFARRLAAFGFGVSDASGLGLLVAAVVLGAFFVHLARLRRRGDARWVFYLTIVLLSPAFFLTFFAPGVLAVRYFALQLVFLSIALADELAEQIARGGAQRALAAGAVAALLLANASYHVRFVELGRGAYLGALQEMARAEPGTAPVTVAADHDSRALLLVNFYKRFVERPIRFVPRARFEEEEPGWFIDHEVHEEDEPPQRIQLAGAAYVLHARYDFAYLSGFRWNLYRRARPR